MSVSVICYRIEIRGNFRGENGNISNSNNERERKTFSRNIFYLLEEKVGSGKDGKSSRKVIKCWKTPFLFFRVNKRKMEKRFFFLFIFESILASLGCASCVCFSILQSVNIFRSDIQMCLIKLRGGKVSAQENINFPPKQQQVQRMPLDIIAMRLHCLPCQLQIASLCSPLDLNIFLQ